MSAREGPDGEPNLGMIAETLRRGEPVPDSLFDAVYPLPVQQASAVCWTPVHVAREVIRLIAPSAETRLLDIGSGPGKFCTIAALMAPGRYTGVEQKDELHRVAQETGRKLGAERASFILGDALELDWSPFNVLYLFNPFQEFLAKRVVVAAGLSLMTSEDWASSARRTLLKLFRMPKGTVVAVHNGYGMEMPEGYDVEAVGRGGTAPLVIWRKHQDGPGS